jgi:nitroimidazol reductase NimA-like FMN-containing flavoprotein (pyridoxamine 5'-phosphate oxidase superfamily)
LIEGASVEQQAISILNQHGVMALATVRPDGWPQVTMIGYVNDELTLYFLISRTSQKFQNISANDRVSIAIGSEAADPHAIEGLSLAAHVEEVRDEPYRSQFSTRLAERHPGYFKPERLDFKSSALMRARPTIVTLVDFSDGLGHAEAMNLGADGLAYMEPARPNNWGPNPHLST